MAAKKVYDKAFIKKAFKNNPLMNSIYVNENGECWMVTWKNIIPSSYEKAFLPDGYNDEIDYSDVHLCTFSNPFKGWNKSLHIRPTKKAN